MEEIYYLQESHIFAFSYLSNPEKTILKLLLSLFITPE
jgi:hypothetical protein